MGEPREKVTIKIPRPLYANLQEIIRGTGFNSVTEFIVYILRDIASSRGRAEGGHLTTEEIRLIRERLRSLGYL